MSKLFQNTAFGWGFWLGILIFGLLNIFSYVNSRAEQAELDGKLAEEGIRFADAGGYSMGFPFVLYRWDFGYPFHFYFVWSGLIADILIGLILSFLVGLIFKFVWEKFTAKRLK
jgi:hypothetical protein